MNTAVLGTGMVGQILSAKLASLDHQVTIGTRDVAATLARHDKDAYGRPAFSDWYEDQPDIQLDSFANASSQAELVINAISGGGSLAALELAGEDNLNGKILIDIANPLDFSQGMPPTLSIVNTDSLAEQIQQHFPKVKVVKTLNTMNASLMVDPQQLLQGDHSVFVSGNDADAKANVSQLLQSFGWHVDNIIDLGDISTARGTEMLLPIWLRLYGALETPMFNFKVVH
ncbi:MAG: NAD(P)-binding domain-containing protein [Deinococcota bacterium]